MERKGCRSEEGGHILLVEGKLSMAMRESKEDCLGVHVPSCGPFVCVADNFFMLGRVGHVFGEADSNSLRYFVSLNFVDRGGVVGCEDRVEIDGFPSQEGKPLLLREFRTFGRVGEAAPGRFEIEGVVLNKLEGAL